MIKGRLMSLVELDGDPTERAFFRDFRDVNHQNDLGIG